MRKKKILALTLATVLVLAIAATALAATSIPPPFQCGTCGTRQGLVKVRTMWTTSNPPQVVWELWQCGNGHRFYNYPPIGV